MVVRTQAEAFRPIVRAVPQGRAARDHPFPPRLARLGGSVSRCRPHGRRLGSDPCNDDVVGGTGQSRCVEGNLRRALSGEHQVGERAADVDADLVEQRDRALDGRFAHLVCAVRPGGDMHEAYASAGVRLLRLDVRKPDGSMVPLGSLLNVREIMGADRVIFGSDWPHPEGLSEPRKWIGDFVGLGEADMRLALRELNSKDAFNLNWRLGDNSKVQIGIGLNFVIGGFWGRSPLSYGPRGASASRYGGGGTSGGGFRGGGPGVGK